MSNNVTNKIETMAVRHDRLYNTTPMSFFLNAVASDWKSGDMALNRMEMVITSNCYVVTQMKGYKKYVGKLERIGRLGKSGYNLNTHMGKVTPNEIHAYLLALIAFLAENGWDHLTPRELMEVK